MAFIVAFFFAFLAKFLCRGATGLPVPRPEKNTKTFARKLPRDFETNSFVSAGH